ncbi:AraC family transcriptional regulator [Achromobacter denitrificans]|uniref:helix-turn-helix domain-containing protein n=1 Tax=Achromobacter denitrificans TaxID=32002 RepID=UPI000B4DEE94|nr:helix-turn-helix domain-containing protein [Achromobacter denitrificans]ASC66459.1 AraC family transcriptional regulator [Achromobacter denitrificans]
MAPEWHNWSTHDHGQHALAFWHDAVCAGVLDSEFRAEPDTGFAGTMSSQTRSGARLVNFASSPHMIRRSQRHVSRVNGDHLMLSLQLEGRALMSQGDEQLCLQPGEFGLLDTGSAFDITFPESTARRLVLLPRHALSARAPGLRRLRAPASLPADMPFAPVLAETMRLLTDSAVKLQDRTVDTLLDTVIEIVALHCASAAPSTELSFVGVKRHIDTAIADPALSPASAAAACRISVRTLHRLFARHAQLSFEAYVVQARLALAHELLSAGRTRTVSEAAFACGFNNLSHFTRRFSERYGDLPVNLLKQGQARA